MLRGSVVMSQYEDGIKKICKSIFALSNMNTAFIDSTSQLKFEYGDNYVFESLENHLGNMYDILQLHEIHSKHDVLFHSSSYKINFISAKIFEGMNYLGSIIIGPYLMEEPTTIMLQDVLFENKLSITFKHTLTQYYLSLPCISTYKAKIIAEFLAYSALMVDTIGCQIPNIGNIAYSSKTHYPLCSTTIKQKDDLSATLIEKRYHIENQLMFAVESGDKEKLDILVNEHLHSFASLSNRIPNNPLRTCKNVTFVVNTLLRKAAEKGGLSPVDIHSISENYAIQIEKASSLQQTFDIMKEMYVNYCTAVKNLSLKGFSHLIRKAIVFIRTNLDQDLSLEAISNAIQLSSYELSRQFKKETGQTITEYINKQRINEAVYMLRNTTISITDIAQFIGFNDPNYFTTVFKKIEGISPSEYRKNKQ